MSTNKICFHGEIRKIAKLFGGKSALFHAILSNIFTFIGHKSKMTVIDMLIFHYFFLQRSYQNKR